MVVVGPIGERSRRRGRKKGMGVGEEETVTGGEEEEEVEEAICTEGAAGPLLRSAGGFVVRRCECHVQIEER